MKKIIALLLAFVMAFSLCACGAAKEENAQNDEVGQNENTENGAEETRVFTDSAGRQVEIPMDIQRIIPSGDMAQMFLWPLGGDKLVAVSRRLNDLQKEYLGDATDALPEVGNLYKTGDQLNIEEVAMLNADIIIDFGEAKENIAEDLDALQALLGVPCVFISGTLENSADSYRMLGELLNMPQEAEELAEFVEKVIETAQKAFETVEKKDAVVLNGTDGLGCIASGTYFDEIWAYMLNNVAVTDQPQMYASTGIDLEQLANWDPEYIFFYNGAEPADIATAGGWADLKAVQEGKFYSVPAGPYSYVSPPSVNRYLAIIWLSEILYPGEFGWDTAEMTKEFYNLFYHYELDEAGYEKLLETTA